MTEVLAWAAVCPRNYNSLIDTKTRTTSPKTFNAFTLQLGYLSSDPLSCATRCRGCSSIWAAITPAAYAFETGYFRWEQEVWHVMCP
jgi:hypothetical protein